MTGLDNSHPCYEPPMAFSNKVKEPEHYLMHFFSCDDCTGLPVTVYIFPRVSEFVRYCIDFCFSFLLSFPGNTKAWRLFADVW